MAGFLLVIDDRDRIKAVVEQAVGDAGIKVLRVGDLATAKRMLIQTPPDLILSSLSLEGNSESGFRFCTELQAHSELSQVPVILVADELSEELIRRGTESGARGMVAWPLSGASLRNRLSAIFPALETPLAQEPVKQQPSAAEKQAVSSAATQPSAEAAQKLQTVQRLLAQVLHNLKTSDLLEIADLEDVPRVVMEMTRSVCGEAAARTSRAESSPEREKETELDLDRAFIKRTPG